MRLLYPLAAALIGQTVANSVTPPAAAASTFVIRSEKQTASPSSTILPPSSPELPAPTPAGGNAVPDPAVDGGGPEITTEPDTDSTTEVDINYVQTTYYSCVTIGTYSHCGWHIPILEAGAQRAGNGVSVAIRAGTVALIAGTIMTLW